MIKKVSFSYKVYNSLNDLSESDKKLVLASDEIHIEPEKRSVAPRRRVADPVGGGYAPRQGKPTGHTVGRTG